jgi:hypothetical protein
MQSMSAGWQNEPKFLAYRRDGSMPLRHAVSRMRSRVYFGKTLGRAAAPSNIGVRCGLKCLFLV